MKIITKFFGACIILYFIMAMIVNISDQMKIKKYQYEGIKFKVENNTIESSKLINKISDNDEIIFDLLFNTKCFEYGSSLKITDGEYDSAEIIIVRGYLGEEDNNAYGIYRSEAIRYKKSEWQYYKLNEPVSCTKISERELSEKGFQRYKNNKYDEEGDVIPEYIKEYYENMSPGEKERLNKMEVVNSIIRKELGGQITKTTLTSLTVNENLGTDIENDVIVLANLSWSAKNEEERTKKRLEIYSDHLAATIAPELKDGSEIALFWEATYTGLDIKYSYYVKDGNAYKQ